jgi:hypothetical protein
MYSASNEEIEMAYFFLQAQGSGLEQGLKT